MKKLSALLIALQFISVNLFADTETEYQWQSPDGQVKEYNGKLSYVKGDDSMKINIKDNDNAAHTTFYSFMVDGQTSCQNVASGTTASGSIVITMNTKLQRGDKLTITGYQNSSAKSWMSTLDIQIGGTIVASSLEAQGYWPNLDPSEETDSPRSFEYIVEEQSEGENTITLTLAEGTEPIYVTDITVSREVASSAEMQAIISCHEGYLNSFCYPYTVTCSEGARFYYFDGVRDGYVYGTPVEDGILKAGVPYLYIPTGSSITIERTESTENSVGPKNYNGIYGNHSLGLVLSGKKYKVLSSDGLVYCSSSGTTIKKWTCYFVNSEIVRTTSSSNSKSVCLSSAIDFFDDASTTGIDDIETAKAKNTPIYNMGGQTVSSPRHGGVYIVNGKKVVMK